MNTCRLSTSKILVSTTRGPRVRGGVYGSTTRQSHAFWFAPDVLWVGSATSTDFRNRKVSYHHKRLLSCVGGGGTVKAE